LYEGNDGEAPGRAALEVPLSASPGLAEAELLRRDDLPAFHAMAERMVAANEMWYVLALTDAMPLATSPRGTETSGSRPG
jgi:hypothetical protein